MWGGGGGGGEGGGGGGGARHTPSFLILKLKQNAYLLITCYHYSISYCSSTCCTSHHELQREDSLSQQDTIPETFYTVYMQSLFN